MNLLPEPAALTSGLCLKPSAMTVEGDWDLPFEQSR
jgi:hypothetical protein